MKKLIWFLLLLPISKITRYGIKVPVIYFWDIKTKKNKYEKDYGMHYEGITYIGTVESGYKNFKLLSIKENIYKSYKWIINWYIEGKYYHFEWYQILEYFNYKKIRNRRYIKKANEEANEIFRKSGVLKNNLII